MANGQDAQGQQDLPVLSKSNQSSTQDRAGGTRKRNRDNIEDTTEMAQCATSLVQLAGNQRAAVPKTLAQNAQLHADTARSHQRVFPPKMATRSRQVFPIFDALSAHPEVILYLTTQHLDPATMLTLYSISRHFHYLVNSRYTTYMMCSARRWARLLPEHRIGSVLEEGPLWGTEPDQPPKEKSTASGPIKYIAFPDPMHPSKAGEYNIWDITTLLPFNNYVHLCTADPTLRTTSGSATAPSTTTPSNIYTEANPNTTTPTSTPPIRHVPTFRYLFFLLHRSSTILSILAHMRNLGHPLPYHLGPALAKLSLLIDIPTTARRLALLHNPRYFAPSDLQLLTLFFLKLDMLCTDPLDGDVASGAAGIGKLRECLLAQRSLSTLEAVLGRRMARSNLEMMQLWVAWKYVPRVEHRGLPIMGVKAEDVGCLAWEGWRAPWSVEGAKARAGVGAVGAEETGEEGANVPRRLMGVEEGVMREGIRRGLRLEKMTLAMLLFGFE